MHYFLDTRTRTSIDISKIYPKQDLSACGDEYCWNSGSGNTDHVQDREIRETFCFFPISGPCLWKSES